MVQILIIDDDPVALRILSRVLADDGYAVRTAMTAEEALGLAGTFQPDLLLTDWLLRDDRDGIDLARALHKPYPAMRIMFATGLPADDLRGQLQGLPVSKIYEKPMNLEQLIRDIAAEFSPAA